MPVTNAFGTYLQTKDLLRGADTRDGSTVPGNSLSIPAIKLLVNQHFPQSLPALLQSSGLSLEDFSRAIASLQEAGIVTVDENDKQETVSLTDQGEELVK